MNENNTNGVRFITNISDTYFNSERDLDVNLFRNEIIEMIKHVANLSGNEQSAEEIGGKKIKIKKKKTKSKKKIGKKKRKKRKKTKKH